MRFSRAVKERCQTPSRGLTTWSITFVARQFREESTFFVMFGKFNRDVNVKRHAVAFRAFAGNRALQPVRHEMLNNVQPQAAAALIPLRRVKRLENFAKRGGRNPVAIIVIDHLHLLCLSRAVADNNNKKKKKKSINKRNHDQVREYLRK